MLTHLCQDEPIQFASSTQHQVSQAASTQVLHPIDQQEALRLLVLAHVHWSTPVTCAARHLTPS